MSAGLARIRHGVRLGLQEAWHWRAGWMIAAVAIAIIGLAALLREFNFGTEEPRFLINSARVALQWCGALYLALAGPALVHGGIESRLAALMFVRGMRRGEWLVAQWLVLLALTGGLAVVAGLALAAALAALGHGAVAPAGWALLASGAGPLIILAGASLFSATLTRSTPLATVVTLALAVAGQLAPVLRVVQDRAGTVQQWLWRGLDWLVPDFSVFQSAGSATALLHAFGYSAAYGLAAFLILRRRDI